MPKTIVLSTAVILASATAGLAQGFSGAELGIDYSSVPDVTDLRGFSYYGSAEVAIFRGLSFALDATAYDFELGDIDITNFTAHAIYQVDPAVSLGFFIGQDIVDGDKNGMFGGEVLYDYVTGTIEGYLGSASNLDGKDAKIYGASATYDMTGGFSFGADLDAFRGDGFSSSAFEIGGFYTMLDGPKFGATIGKLNLQEFGNKSEFYFGFEASIAVGPNRGTTFERRSLFEVLQSGSAS